jgi:hypothetical protein
VVISSTLIGRILSRLLLTAPAPPEHASIRRKVGVDGLHECVQGREQAGKQRATAGRPEVSHELLVSPDGEDRGQKFLQHLKLVSNPKGLKGVRVPTSLHGAF